MFGRKILFLAAWYIAGNVVSSVYSGTRKSTKKVSKKRDPKVFAEEFIATQKNFLADMEEKYISEKNKKKFEEKKKQFLQASEKYIEEGSKMFSELTENKNFKEQTSKAKSFLSSQLENMKSSLSGEQKSTKKK